MGATAAVHPTDETLYSYGLGKLDLPLTESVDKHLEDCDICQRRVAAMSSDDRFLGRLRDVHGQHGSTGPVVSSIAGLSMLQDGASIKAPPPTDTLPPGLADHPDYEVIRELGQGGMGTVYLAKNRLMGRHEVLKVVSRHMMNRPSALDRFLVEIRNAARLAPHQHRHGLFGHAHRREHRLRDGVRRGTRPVEAGQGEGTAAGFERLQLRSSSRAGAATRERARHGPPRYQAEQPDAGEARESRR